MIEVDHVSKWFGDVVAVSDVTFRSGRASPPCSGPNGAGKSTVLRLLCGLARPSQAGCGSSAATPAATSSLLGRIGLVPQQEALFESLTAREFVETAARLLRVPDPDAAAAAALGQVEVVGHDRRPVQGLLEGQPPAGQGGGRARPRPGGPRARRAAQRPRPPPAPPPHRSGPAPRRRAGPLRRHLEPRARRGRAVRLARPRHRPGPPGRRGRLPRHPRPHGRPPPPPAHRAPTPPAGSPPGCSRPAWRRACASPAPSSLEVETSDVHGFRRSVAVIARERGAPLDEVVPLDDDLDSVFRYLVGR